DGPRQGLIEEGPGRTGGHALTARHTGRLAHWQVVIKRNTGRIALAGTSNDVVALHVITGAYAAITHNAGIMVHLNYRRRHILSLCHRPRREAWCGNALLRREIEQQIGFARGTL